jgi:hypothetical protein
MARTATAPPSRFLRWKESSRLSWEEIASLVVAQGGAVKARTLDHIARGRRRPSYELAVILSAITEIPVPLWMACRTAPASTPDAPAATAPDAGEAA